MISVWAKFEPGTDNFDELERQGFLYPDQHDWSGPDRYYDAFSPDARAVYWRQMRDHLFRNGIDGWWLDATEPEIAPAKMREFDTALGPGGYVLNAYSLMTTQGVYQGQRKETNDKRVFILTRSVFSGQQRNAAATWSGDIQGTWDVFRRQVAGGLNFCMAGVPYWCTDIGGFFSPPNSDPEYKELFTRWFQWGTFCPIYRVHGTGTDKELWRFGPDTEKVLVRYDNLRYRLMPYIYSLAWRVTHDGYTMMRALPMDYRSDRNTWDVKDQLLFGPSLMVSPVLEPKVPSRSVYLPLGPRWTDFWTGYSAMGGKSIRCPTPIETMPIHVPTGSIIPMGPTMQYTSEKAVDPIELRVYPGADGRFELYEDEGDGYAYEKGAHATIPMLWNDKQRTLLIGARQGAYPGMPFSRRFQVVLVRPGHGIGLAPCGRPERTVTYDGRALTLRIAG
jgi:alpha-D-xyloside xylohydrolase